MQRRCSSLSVPPPSIRRKRRHWKRKPRREKGGATNNWDKCKNYSLVTWSHTSELIWEEAEPKMPVNRNNNVTVENFQHLSQRNSITLSKKSDEGFTMKFYCSNRFSWGWSRVPPPPLQQQQQQLSQTTTTTTTRKEMRSSLTMSPSTTTTASMTTTGRCSTDVWRRSPTSYVREFSKYSQKEKRRRREPSSLLPVATSSTTTTTSATTTTTATQRPLQQQQHQSGSTQQPLQQQRQQSGTTVAGTVSDCVGLQKFMEHKMANCQILDLYQMLNLSFMEEEKGT